MVDMADGIGSGTQPIANSSTISSRSQTDVGRLSGRAPGGQGGASNGVFPHPGEGGRRGTTSALAPAIASS